MDYRLSVLRLNFLFDTVFKHSSIFSLPLDRVLLWSVGASREYGYSACVCRFGRAHAAWRQG